MSRTELWGSLGTLEYVVDYLYDGGDTPIRIRFDDGDGSWDVVTARAACN